MRRRGATLIALIGLLVLVGIAPGSGFAQSPVSPPTPAAVKSDDTTRVLMIGLGAATGMLLFSGMNTNMITATALSRLGLGVIALAGTVVGGVAGNWLYAREYR